MEVRDQIKRLIAQTLRIPLEKLRDDTALEDLGAKSMDIVEIVYDIEEKFGISIPFRPGEAQESMTKLQNIADITRTVKSLIDAKRSG